ncbi:MAG: 4-hydroxythreonine-4-phosphate dehydrogenase [Candidatus Omnitrophota bacterium]
MNSEDKPIIAITMGDPAGIGSEVIVKALESNHISDICEPIVIGDYQVMHRALLDSYGIDCTQRLGSLENIDELEKTSYHIPVLDLKNVLDSEFTYGVVKKEYGLAAGEYIKTATQLALDKKIDAVVTAPIHKQSFREAGYPYPGHTEMFTSLCKAKNTSLMLVKDSFRVVHVTMHSALKDVPKLITHSKVLDCIQVAYEGMLAIGILNPRIGVCGLNPHAGESGQFGLEDENEILPAVLEAKKSGMDIEGPLPADTIFPMLKGGRFDIVVAMYHDQGGIPMKLLSFDWDDVNSRWGDVHGVNVTLGLPIIRTSVAHGTAFEVTGKNIASPGSMIDAIEMAVKMVRFKRK